MKIYAVVKAGVNLYPSLIFHVKRAAEIVEDEDLNRAEDPLSNTQQVGMISTVLIFHEARLAFYLNKTKPITEDGSTKDIFLR